MSYDLNNQEVGNTTTNYTCWEKHIVKHVEGRTINNKLWILKRKR